MKRINIAFFLTFCIVSLLFYVACTPKSTEPAQATVSATKVKPPVNTANLSPCQKWVNESFEQEALEIHVLYRDQMKAQNYKAVSYTHLTLPTNREV